MRRLLLAFWLALFAVQTTDLIAAVSPDECVEYGTGAADDCPDSCARCVCCARVPVFVPSIAVPSAAEPVAVLPVGPPSRSPASAEPHGVFHVPKTR